MKKLAPIFVVFAALASHAGAQIVKRGNAYLFRMKFVPGTTTKYKVNSTIDGIGSNGQGIKVMLPMSWNVASVTKGVATINATVGPVTVGKQQMMQPSTTEVKLDSRGRPVDGETPGQQLTPAFPQGPVKVGTSWTASMPVQGINGQAAKVTATYRFNGIKTVNGKQVADLTVTTSGTATGAGTMQLLVSDGSLFTSYLKMKVSLMNSGKPTSYNITANIVRS